MPDRTTLHALAWLAWIAAIVVIATVTRNPLYLGLTMLWIVLVSFVLRVSRRTTEFSPAPFSPLRFGLLVLTVSAFFNALMVHMGSTALFSLPRSIPLIGGPITVEAMVYGALNGGVLALLYGAFSLLNRAVSLRQLVRLIPRAYYPVAVVVSIAIAFVPTTLHQIAQIREAQAVRGHKVRGLRSWLPLLMPLLTGGLEQALQLSEAMMARGFAGAEDQRSDTLLRSGLVVGLVVVAAGWLLRLFTGQHLWGTALLLAGVLLIGVAIWWAGKRHPHTSYRPQPWTGRDWFVLLGSLFTSVLFLGGLPNLDRSSLYYTPYLTLRWPTFSVAYGAVTWGLLAPAIVLAIAALRNELERRSAPSRAAGNRP